MFEQLERALEFCLSAGCIVASGIAAFMLWSTLMGGDWLSDAGRAVAPIQMFGTQVFLIAAIAFLLWSARRHWRNATNQ